ncbi:MAG: GNAT family N-acetyltransferase [Chloroflexi bacterium]|nr:GNAT family N-acetyltransferase [Chloroflexota bacterium]MDA1146315.1 GNAT family N-acetyltransferase [Chloroflexota bacterium]
MGFGDTLMSLLAGRSWRVANQAAAQRLEPFEFPATVELSGGPISLRPMESRDREAMLVFANSLPPHDLLFLRRDITQPEVVDDWVADIAAARYLTILALKDNEIVGYATVASDGLAWTRHVAELRILVSPRMRGQQLGRLLIEQAFAFARERGVRKMIAQMTTDQQAAMRVFGHIGFEREARLRNQLIDRDGQLHDLQIMSLDVDEFRAKVDLMAVSAQHELV